jgi:hypothetical protein
MFKIHSTHTRGLFGHHIHRLLSRLRDSCNRWVRQELSTYGARQAKTATTTPPVATAASTPTPPIAATTSQPVVAQTSSEDEWSSVGRERSAPIHERQPDTPAVAVTPSVPRGRFDDGEPIELRESLSFIRWIEDLLITNMYPGAPFERTVSYFSFRLRTGVDSVDVYCLTHNRVW